jgi:hydrogenase maturation protein HypF
LHPQLNTTILAERLSKKLKIPLYQVQHHHAHTAKLMAEHDLDEIVCIVCDGFGYGQDGTAWGGEILYSNASNFERLAHLEKHPLIGGDLATLNPLRMAASILYDNSDFREWIRSKDEHFPHKDSEIDLVLKDAERKKGVLSSSCGRVLDAAAAILGISYKRTYEGEPAMKLESVANGGKYLSNVSPQIDGKTLLTKPLIESLFELRKKEKLSDLAYTAHMYLANGLTTIALHEAECRNIKHIGFTGGVAYNRWITKEIRSQMKRLELPLYLNEKVPCGDGGISLGQAYSSLKQ